MVRHCVCLFTQEDRRKYNYSQNRITSNTFPYMFVARIAFRKSLKRLCFISKTKTIQPHILNTNKRVDLSTIQIT